MNLALFDFDGTITNKDSLFQFVKFAVGKPTFYVGLCYLSPLLIAYKLKLISNQKTKEKFLNYYFKHWKETQFKKVAQDYSASQIDSIIRLDALKRIKWHQQQGDTVVLVSASIECWLEAWCHTQSINLIATRLAFKNNQLCLYFATKNCFGIEKVKRIKEQYDLSQFDHIYAYGDSSGDKQMLELADKAYYQIFNG